MAHAPRLDFDAFVSRMKSERTAQGAAATAHEYTYSFDRQSRVAFENTKPVALAVEASVRIFKQMGQSQLLGQAVQVSERQFPRIHGLARRASDTLQIAPPKLFVVNSPTLNAATYGTNDDSFVVVHSALVDQYSDAELLAVIGHECGHIHNSHVAYLTALHYLTNMAGVFVPWVLQPALIALRAWSRRAEITCDRAAMLVSGDAQTAERAIAKLAVGSTRLYEEFNLDVFLEQHDESSRGVGRFMEMFASHPWLPKRVLAMRVFEESRLFRAHLTRLPRLPRLPRSGQPSQSSGPTPLPAGLSMGEVDDRVAALLKGDA